ncbi:methyl-accepting chemotaxis protein [Undibacterium luofuense]|uniref:methyl-accepting chemotaxis protein n=1 Tax=Undibacterium luofuense TaxID=2828733 RepID=UPI0030EE2C8A
MELHQASIQTKLPLKFSLPIHSVLRIYAVLSAIVLLLLGWQAQAWLSGMQMLTIGLGLITSGIFTISVHRLIAGQVGQLRHHIQAMSAGDLSQPIAVHGRHEISELAQSLRVLQTNMKLLIGQIKQSSGHVHAIGSDVSECSGELAQHTESQKGSLEQTASSMEQITVAVQHNAANSREASEVAIRSAGLADTSGRAVQKVVQTMGAIRHSSSRIADIISVIDGIAFQTNILALNAAVEAARAGDQGRGFSVVASEVRALAQRSASAAKEIKELIQHSVEQVEQGAELVDEAGQSMDELVSGVKKVAALMQEFTVSTQEQSLGISTVNQSVIEIDEMTQQNMQIVSAATYSAEKLEEEVSVLRDLVNAFELTTQQNSVIQMQPRMRRVSQDQSGTALQPVLQRQIEKSR